ncbi:carboxylesterase family protein, partial [Streptomyces viridochromogenes]|uniref:carboxylesterase family protein n=1 Tax=Streptomyces viridochromogenes TaxID=1938 RepID=UPI0001B4DAD4
TMTAYWAHFAATGDPNAPGTEPWPRYTADGDHIQVLTPERVGPTTEFAADHHCAFWQPAPVPGGAVR